MLKPKEPYNRRVFIYFIHTVSPPLTKQGLSRTIVKNSLYLQFWKSASLLTKVIAISWALAQHKGCAAECVDSAPVAQLISVCCCAAVTVTAHTRRHSIAAPLGRAFEVMFGCSVLLFWFLSAMVVCLRECGCCCAKGMCDHDVSVAFIVFMCMFLWTISYAFNRQRGRWRQLWVRWLPYVGRLFW